MDGAQRYLVYRLSQDDEIDPATAVRTADNLLGVTGRTSFTDHSAERTGIHSYFIQAVGYNSAGGEPSAVVTNRDAPTFLDRPSEAEWKPVQIFPNPFAQSTTIRVATSERSRISVNIYNVASQLVTTLAHAIDMPSGIHEFEWTGTQTDGSNVPRGAYFVEVMVDGQRQTRLVVRAE